MTATNESAETAPQERYTVHTHGAGSAETFRVWDTAENRYVLTGREPLTEIEANSEIEYLKALDRLDAALEA
jgi:hypothetical protein